MELSNSKNSTVVGKTDRNYTRAQLFESRLTLIPDLKITKEFISLIQNVVQR